ncbi:MAG TPA: hypothetical protein VNT27_00500 [Propionibacteriaceae bacterium]|nr:hypothetical protein [Propionibacteriaceae bacterium]
MLTGCDLEVGERAVLETERGVSHDYKVQHADIAGRRQDRLGRCGDPQAVDEVDADGLRVAADQEPGAVRTSR